jgi:hypothetical protein
MVRFLVNGDILRVLKKKSVHIAVKKEADKAIIYLET